MRRAIWNPGGERRGTATGDCGGGRATAAAADGHGWPRWLLARRPAAGLGSSVRVSVSSGDVVLGDSAGGRRVESMARAPLRPHHRWNREGQLPIAPTSLSARSRRNQSPRPHLTATGFLDPVQDTQHRPSGEVPWRLGGPSSGIVILVVQNFGRPRRPGRAVRRAASLSWSAACGLIHLAGRLTVGSPSRPASTPLSRAISNAFTSKTCIYPHRPQSL